jgi:translation elongation factor aEF-1 beta
VDIVEKLQLSTPAASAGLQDQTKMAQAIITFKLMMESPDTDIEAVKQKAKELLTSLGADVGKEEVEPVAFGLKALKLVVVADEDLGTDTMESKLNELENVSSAEVVDYRRALG